MKAKNQNFHLSREMSGNSAIPILLFHKIIGNRSGLQGRSFRLLIKPGTQCGIHCRLMQTFVRIRIGFQHGCTLNSPIPVDYHRHHNPSSKFTLEHGNRQQTGISPLHIIRHTAFPRIKCRLQRIQHSLFPVPQVPQTVRLIVLIL